ncbi:hypothetical protein R70006_04960 [Paraburkholderia domus]|uniref:hypothetical protein n=1 Tax=Paraburkholderia domus TaxID=2793075 RepID=UPI001912C391|nr:hypothetical protein [Paraburkholderia domus]MBK5051804.1 hypothetical protein [Burkholderia sp. R-70006]CAE6793501.1 hypothetical protein R70006_04960 [Paraburkholderia domus]
MKLSDFAIGTEFETSTGQRWRCTDVGSRTILAIEVKPDLDESWLTGPPYIVDEIPFDQRDMSGAFRTVSEAVDDSLQHSAHPNFPNEVVSVFARARLTKDAIAYPRKKLLRVDRVSASGVIFHPYGVEKEGATWAVLVFELFARTYHRMSESEFVHLRPATENDLRKRRGALESETVPRKGDKA